MSYQGDSLKQPGDNKNEPIHLRIVLPVSFFEQN
jgi:hypothetical protein